MHKTIILFLFSFFSNLSFAQSNFVVIVNDQNPLSSIEKHFLADVFFKKITHWPNDGVIKPVDLKYDSQVRHDFSLSVLKRSVMGIKSYWQQLIFSGQNIPPPELSDDLEVIRYVNKNPGAIGYVSTVPQSAQSGIKILSIK